MTRHSLNESIPTHLAFSVLLILSFLTAWYAIYAGGKIVESAKQSEALNVDKRNNLQDDFKK